MYHCVCMCMWLHALEAGGDTVKADGLDGHRPLRRREHKQAVVRPARGRRRAVLGLQHLQQRLSGLHAVHMHQ
jgi:hypothetical protein